MPLLTRLRDGLLYEPSYFFEAASGVGIFLWSFGALTSDDYHISGCGYVMPVAGVVFGLWRLWLIRRDPIWRAAAAAGGMLWWILLVMGIVHHYGIMPMEGPCVAFAMGDFLTLCKFRILAREVVTAHATT